MSNKTDKTVEEKIYFEGELMSPREWRNKYIQENDVVNAVPFNLYDGNLMEKYAKYYFWYNSNAIAEEVGKLSVKVEGGLAPGMKTTTYINKEKVLKIIKGEKDG